MRRRRHVHEEHTSHERWLVSYADFITLLFAFFVVLFASVYRDNKNIVRLSNAIHNAFQNMGAFSSHAGAQNAYVIPAESMGPLQSDQQLELARQRAAAASQAEVQQLRSELQAAMGDALKNHEMDMRVTPEGFVVSLRELGFFDSGQAELLPGAANKITRIAKILTTHGLELRVEGHSDNQPINNSDFRNNWELSTARAMTVLLLMVDKAGYDPTKISVAGYAQYRPIANDSTPEGRRMNRRVDLVVVGTAPSAIAQKK
ncbi:MAG TPA: OmpA family protein [Acidobacteriaceae bacterium]|nr:OmpA family protein [Acidobacteriaceae bacterium]